MGKTHLTVSMPVTCCRLIRRVPFAGTVLALPDFAGSTVAKRVSRNGGAVQWQ